MSCARTITIEWVKVNYKGDKMYVLKSMYDELLKSLPEGDEFLTSPYIYVVTSHPFRKTSSKRVKNNKSASDSQ